MLEKEIESRLVRVVKESGGLCLKLTGYKGIPDRLILTKAGQAIFVELKAPGKVPRTEQVFWQEKLQKMKFKAIVIDSYEKINALKLDLMRAK